MEPIQIIFEAETPYGTFCDALYFLTNELPSDEVLERLKQERVDNWIAVITAPPVEEVPQDG